jgi:hypothetical protein
MDTKKFLLVSMFSLILGLSLFAGNVNAQTVDGTATTTDSGMTDTSGGAVDLTATTTSPGVPNTGAGGNATLNLLILLVSASIGMVGVSYLYRKQMRT